MSQVKSGTKIRILFSSIHCSICEAHAKQNQEIRILKIKRDAGMGQSFDYPGSILEGRVRIYKIVRNTRACQSKFKTEQTILQACMALSRIARGQRNVSHFEFECTKCEYCWSKVWRELHCRCRNMADAPKRQEWYWWIVHTLWKAVVCGNSFGGMPFVHPRNRLRRKLSTARLQVAFGAKCLQATSGKVANDEKHERSMLGGGCGFHFVQKK